MNIEIELCQIGSCSNGAAPTLTSNNQQSWPNRQANGSKPNGAPVLSAHLLLREMPPCVTPHGSRLQRKGEGKVVRPMEAGRFEHRRTAQMSGYVRVGNTGQADACVPGVFLFLYFLIKNLNK